MNLMLVIKGDMFADGIVYLQEKPDVKEFEAKLRSFAQLTDAEYEKWNAAYFSGGNVRGFVCLLQDPDKLWDGDGRWLMVVYTGRAGWESTLAHEALHAAEKSCAHRGIPVCEETEELRAMLVGKIFEKTKEEYENYLKALKPKSTGKRKEFAKRRA